MTGGAGFIGSRLCQRLIADNHIWVYDSLARDALIHTAAARHANLHLIRGDVLDAPALRAAVDQAAPDLVVHMAAVAGIDTVIRSPTRTMTVNVVGTNNLLEALRPRLRDVERLVTFSTSEVFGSFAYKVQERHNTNLAPVGEARWTYSVSKLAAEHLAIAYAREFGLRVVALRPFNVYGPGQVGEGAIHVFVKRAVAGLPLEVHGDGDQIRSWCYIDDMVDGVLLALTKEEAVGEVFNIGNPRGTITILSLAEKIVALSGTSSPIRLVPKTYVDVDLRVPDISKATEQLGYSPRVDLNEGLGHTIAWYRAAGAG
jgi:dTDP-glucose 4,6-dehydratase